jgi:hypothetical protein
MKKLFIIIIIFISFQSWTKADDIRDFEIEGISVGDSLLDYFNKKKITDKINSYDDKGFIYNHKDFYSITFKFLPMFEIYDGVQFFLKNNDNNYIIYSIAGEKYHKDINNCYSKFDEIEDEFDILFKNSSKAEKLKRPHSYDKTGESTTIDVYYNMPNGDFVALVCSDWSEKINISDSFRVEISSDEFADFVNNKAYN